MMGVLPSIEADVFSAVRRMTELRFYNPRYILVCRLLLGQVPTMSGDTDCDSSIRRTRHRQLPLHNF